MNCAVIDFNLLSMESPAEQLDDLQELYGLKQVELAKVLGTSSRSIQRWKQEKIEPSPSHQEKIQLLIAIVRLTCNREDFQSVVKFVNRTSTKLDNQKPVEHLLRGRIRKVFRSLEPRQFFEQDESLEWKTLKPQLFCPGQDFDSNPCKSRLVRCRTVDGWLLECFVRRHRFREK